MEEELLSGAAQHIAVALRNARLSQEERRIGVLEERDRIAREIHDGTAQVLGLIALKSRSARAELEAGNTAAMAEDLEFLAEVADHAYRELREVMLGLRQSVCPEGGLIGALHAFGKRLAQGSNLRVRVEAEPALPARVPPVIEVQLIRVLQEALTNVRRHSGARLAQVRMGCRDGLLWVHVEDNGCGFDPDMAELCDGGMGLLSMRERIDSLGGQMTIESNPGSGTLVRIEVPLNGGEILTDGRKLHSLAYRG